MQLTEAVKQTACSIPAGPLRSIPNLRSFDCINRQFCLSRFSNHRDKKYLLDAVSASIYFRALSEVDRSAWGAAKNRDSRI